MSDQRFFVGLLLTSLIALAFPAPPARAIAHTPVKVGVATSRVWPIGTPLGFRIEISQQFAAMVPYTGALVITIGKNGIINGVYESDSVRPDPLYGKLIPVTGGISDNSIHLQIGTGPRALSIHGTYTENAITGTVLGLPGVWTLRATRVHLHNPPQST
ncbi:MAG: hypothetical protein ACXWNK_09045 [Vulcanimicrobiaceae bacterium]